MTGMTVKLRLIEGDDSEIPTLIIAMRLQSLETIWPQLD